MFEVLEYSPGGEGAGGGSQKHGIEEEEVEGQEK